MPKDDLPPQTLPRQYASHTKDKSKEEQHHVSPLCSDPKPRNAAQIRRGDLAHRFYVSPKQRRYNDYVSRLLSSQSHNHAQTCM